MKKKLKTIEKTAKELLKHLGVEAETKISEGEEETVQIDLKPPDPGILIGYHGETLSSFQLILSMIVYRRLGEWVKILVDVGDYRQRREERLRAMALNAAKRVKFSGESYAMPYLTSAERRLVHLNLADHPDVRTESEGEGRNRRIIIKPK